jgi:hypothetical protein
MNAVVKRLHHMRDDELLSLSEAIDFELDRRLERSDPIPQSARRRANERQGSYRHCNGASAPPIRFVGMHPTFRRRMAA